MPVRRWICVALPLVLLAGCGGRSRHPLTHPVSVFPSDGSRFASPQTQVTIRGAAPRELKNQVEVSGSKSGDHDGALEADSDGRGASFLPAKPFADGERVTVSVGGRAVAHFRVTAPVTAALPPQQASQARVGVERFHSRPDLQPTAIDVGVASSGTAPGDIFVAPKAGESQSGPTILDAHGDLVWFHPLPGDQQATDFRVQRYRGRPVLTWWQGDQRSGIGRGQGVIYDASYRPLARVRAGNGYTQDMHEFQLTGHGTALLDAYSLVHADLSRFGGPKNGLVWDSIVQEIDIRTGLVLFEWHALDHVPIDDSYRKPPKDKIYDYFHVNSVDEMPDGNILVSSRETWAVYALDRSSGRIVWRLGGKHSAFSVDESARFRWQHDARAHGPDEITVFDNDAVKPTTGAVTRGLVIHLDQATKTASLVRAYTHPDALQSPSQGNLQLLPGGNAFVGWGGNNNRFSEFAQDGSLLLDATFASAKDTSYRAYRLPWTGHPGGAPAAVAAGTTVYASWNGATEVAKWRVGSVTVPRTGFETAIQVPGTAAPLTVEALDASGKVLGRATAKRP